MAKRENVKNVEISTEELKPTTIGYLNNKQKGPFLLIIIFAILLGTLFFMGQITDFVNMIFNPELYNEMRDAQRSSSLDSTGVVEELNSGTTLTISGIRFSSFSIKDGELRFSTNTSQASGDFSNYYIETYDRAQKLLERIPMASSSINSVKLTYTNVKFISINRYASGSYPNVNLNDSKLTCVKDEETYTYEFVSGGASKVTFKVSMRLTDSNTTEFNSALDKYTAEAAKGATSGVSKQLNSDESAFTFTKEVDLQSASLSELSYSYSYNTKPEQIAFEMSTRGYRCN